MGIGSKELRDIVDIFPNPSQGHWGRKLFAPKKLVKLAVSHLHERVTKRHIGTFWIYFWASTTFESYRFYSRCSHEWTSWDLLDIMNVNKVDKFLCFKRKVTSKGLSKKLF